MVHGDLRRTLVLTLVFGILLPFHYVSSTNGYSNVTVLEAMRMIDDDMFLVLLDVRNQSEYNEGHLRNALFIPLAELEGRLGELNSTDRILVYCKLGVRSAAASQILVDNGFTEVFNMLGRIEGWIDSEYPVYVKYPSLQDAINNSHVSDTLFVSTGLYPENILINKSLNLMGEDRETTIIDANYSGDVILVLVDNVSISRFTIQGSECMCLGPHGGVKIGVGVQNISITDNIITKNGNVSTPRRGVGVYADSAYNLTIAYNVFTENEAGVLLINASQSKITANFFSDNLDSGIRLEFSDGNMIAENIISYNVYGISLVITDDNLIVHNSFMNNSDHTYIFQSENLWDNGVEGNYWTSHPKTDLDTDGLADAAYHIDAYNVDKYPLIGVFSGYTLHGSSLGIVSNSTINTLDYAHSNNTIRMRVSNTSSDQASGFCRMAIPHSLMSESYNVSVDGGTPIMWNFSLLDNGTHRWIYFAYTYSELEIVIIPEFHQLMIALVILILLSLVLCYGKRNTFRSEEEKWNLGHSLK